MLSKYLQTETLVTFIKQIERVKYAHSMSKLMTGKYVKFMPKRIENLLLSLIC